ncbi:unnamed protein product [Phyllotreta striolata]|uniref:RNA methyltransferase n=1 Tax=Phyllotreta striolata TaxID=444603 RepID=A0A9N9TXN0_PHYSR|nr:unnamed protein product [Phyllotreta striolata]
MSSVQVQVLNPPPVKTNNAGHHKNPGNSKRKNKHDRSSRKRSKSFSGCGILINQKPVLPSKFLLGGNIKDPLNLNSLQDEEINRAMNAVTPKSSPVPTPPRKKGQLDVIIPKNIRDPLNLIDCDDDAEYEQQLCSSIKKAKKKRLKKRRTISATMDAEDVPADVSATSEATVPEASTDSAKIPEIPEAEAAAAAAAAVQANAAPTAAAAAAAATAAKPKGGADLSIDLSKKEPQKKRKSDEHGHHAIKKFKNNSMDKIVSPVVPQPGAWLKRSNSVNKRAKSRQAKPMVKDAKLPLFKDKDKLFQYGNYNRYYGYRNPHNEIDHRMRVFSHHPYLFENKDILDIGCNIGHVTLSVARDFGAKSIVGIDIDPKLISIARKNVKHYVKKEEATVSPLIMLENVMQKRSQSQTKSSYHDMQNKGKGFPNNVTFKQCNYILEDDNLMALEQPQFDVIMCLSVTKWFHLNWGDAGLKQAFRRMYAQLRPGGKLILEPQNWASYKTKKKLTETIFNNYNSIEFFPEKFREYLLSPAVGFAKGEILGYPVHQAKGFRRPIQVFTKSTMFPSERIEATPQSITPVVSSGASDSYRMKTEKYESQTHGPCIEHVYTDMFDGRYCGCADDSNDVNEKIVEELKKSKASVATPVTSSERTITSEEDYSKSSPVYVNVETTRNSAEVEVDNEKSESQGEVAKDGEPQVWPDNT